MIHGKSKQHWELSLTGEPQTSSVRSGALTVAEAAPYWEGDSRAAEMLSSRTSGWHKASQ